MTILYLFFSIVVAVASSVLARKLGDSGPSWISVFLFICGIVVVTVIHYRVFMNTEFFEVKFEDPLLVGISAFLLFIYMSIIPVTILRKAINRSGHS